jgi:putative tryptophan/tyrosine transport system substrate-binding protein
MQRREALAILAGAAIGRPLAARAQDAGKHPRIGFLGNSTPELEAKLVESFRGGLRDLGYAEGRNISIEYRWAEGNYERLPALAAEFIASKVEVIVTAGTPAALAVKRASSSVPLVMVAVGNPGSATASWKASAGPAEMPRDWPPSHLNWKENGWS